MIVALLLVLCSGLTHAVWNLFTKTSKNKRVFLWWIHIFATVALLPNFVLELSKGGFGYRGILLMLGSLMFQCLYILLLPRAYERGDMSRTYPIMRGTGALLVPVVSVWLYGESLSIIGWLGVLSIAAGLFVIGGFAGKREKGEHSVLYFLIPAFMNGLCITGYVLIDKSLLDYLSPLSLLELGNIAYILILTPLVLRSGEMKKELAINWRTIAVGAFLSPGSYFLFLLAVNIAPLSHVAPIREMGTVFGTLLGVFLLKEANGWQRIAMSGVITAGVISIGFWGTP
ncbi:DMT family transporter [Paenibacillus spongiae]|uniref:DMT family transporter n=1 Tax=Paenibacillus spongiae TaxID=2909671 RepID=A0ABY5S796_9BACL|nr:DMT family transporter [Paenibacillus spongiae]UVI29584.1 DMT family transporter [Paenibacillus spongiae]